KRDTNKENRMEFNSVQELKEFVINEVLQAYADRAGKTLAEVRKLFESVDWVKEEVMDKVYEISLQIARNQGFKL
ncbi:hypothetical protein, partial [Pasteurella multocida]